MENLELWGKCRAYYDWNETNSESDEGNMYKEIRYFIVKTQNHDFLYAFPPLHPRKKKLLGGLT